MKLSEFLQNINKMVEADPSILDFDVIASIDDEGNGFNIVNFTPCLVLYNGYEDVLFEDNIDDYMEDNELDERPTMNAICIN